MIQCRKKDPSVFPAVVYGFQGNELDGDPANTSAGETFLRSAALAGRRPEAAPLPLFMARSPHTLPPPAPPHHHTHPSSPAPLQCRRIRNTEVIPQGSSFPTCQRFHENIHSRAEHPNSQSLKPACVFASCPHPPKKIQNTTSSSVPVFIYLIF